MKKWLSIAIVASLFGMGGAWVFHTNKITGRSYLMKEDFKILPDSCRYSNANESGLDFCKGQSNSNTMCCIYQNHIGSATTKQFWLVLRF